MTRTLAEHVAEAVVAILDGEAILDFDTIRERLPEHVLSARPTRKTIINAVKSAGWLPHRTIDDKQAYRAPGLQSDPLARGSNEASGQLRGLIEEVETLKDERRSISGHIVDVYAKAKALGFDVATMRTIEKLRGMDPGKRAEADMLIDTYRHAMGVL